jgi:ComF family protein
LDNCSNFRQSLFGSNCLLCGASSNSGTICRDCIDHLPYLPEARCRLCANPSSSPICGACLAKPPAFSRTLAIFSYDFPIDALIRSLKYRENLALAPFFANMLAEAAKHYPMPDYLLPVPMHPARLKERGFNQAQEIARVVSRKISIEMIQCSKARDTPSQVSLPWKEREKNVRGVFSCESGINGHVAIVDDVMTTGSTLNELAKTLFENGAKDVSAWVVARAVKSV